MKPDIVFKLILPVEESMQRKPGENETAVRRKNRIIEELDFGARKSVHVRADQDYNQELTMIHTNLWDAMYERNQDSDIF